MQALEEVYRQCLGNNKLLSEVDFLLIDVDFLLMESNACLRCKIVFDKLLSLIF